MSTKRLLAELERRAQEPRTWTADQALRVMMLAELLHVASNDAELGMKWWNSLTAEERANWLRLADSVVPADAWRLFKRGVLPS